MRVGDCFFLSLFLLGLGGGGGEIESASSVPPAAAVKPMADMFHGTKVVDNYRWLENGNSPETQKWVEEEMAYTRGMLDRLPGRDAIHKRLTELLSIGSVDALRRSGGATLFLYQARGDAEPAHPLCA